MRTVPAILFVLLLACPAPARSQSFVLQGSAGPTVLDAGIVLGEEAGELLAMVPVRAGIAWRF